MLTVSAQAHTGQALRLDPAGESPTPHAGRAGPGGPEARLESHQNPSLSRYYAKSASPAGQGPDEREKRRRWRHARRRFLWLASSSERVRKCGRVRLEGDTVIRVKDGVGHYAGLVSCGSVWECPVCSAKVKAVRAAEISDAAGRWMDAGHGLYLLTLTVPHDAGMPLAGLWSVLTTAMQGVRSGKAYQRTKADLGIRVSLTAKEITHGAAGWHPHLHVLVFTTKPASADGLFDLLTYTRRAWAREVMAAGLGRPDPIAGVRADICWSGADAGLYVAKCADGRSVGNELARGDLKSAGEGHRTPFEILSDLERFGLVSDRDLWAEYEQVMRGKRALVWSRGYREILGMDQELTDEEIAAADVGGQAVAVLTGDVWHGVLAAGSVLVPWSDTRLPAMTALLEAAERGGLQLVNAVLAVLGVPLAEAPAITRGLEDCPEAVA